MTATTGFVDALHARLLKHTADTGRVRITLTTLLTLQALIEAHAATRPGARLRLSDALDALADQGAVETPRSRQLWDQTGVPALPQWVVVIADIPSKTPPIDMGATTWVPAISRWVGAWLRACRPPTTLRTALNQINNWLLDHLGEQLPTVAREERSLDIFNDEKTLARLESSSIFAASRLRPQDLAYERPVSPPRAARLAVQGDLLIVENQATFDSAWRRLRHEPGSFAAVAFGNGWEAAQAEPLIALANHLQLRTPPERVFYAGDLDIDGLDIPQTLVANINGSSLGFPEPRPLHSAYHAMLTPDRKRTGRPAEPVSDDLSKQAASWLDDEHRQRAQQLLSSGERIAQEVLNRSWWANAELVDE